jgi:hypothetical protein
MKPRDCFGIVVRTIGLLMLFVSGFYLMSGVAILETQSPAEWHWSAYLVYGVALFSIGLYMIRGAPHLVRFAYGGEKEEPKPKEPE